MAESETAVLGNPQDAETFARWKAELDFARKDKTYTDWLERCKKIIARYRDERKNALEEQARRLNILWSNVQTLKPAVYGRQPIPLVERRFMDRDPAARTASMLLERTLAFQQEVGYYHSSLDKAVLDYLLAGMGQVWVRYEPRIESAIAAYDNAEVKSQEKTAEDIEEEGDGEPYEQLAFEKVCVDYVHYTDFLWGPARCWEEVPWVGRRSYLTHSRIAERFFGGDLAQAKKVTLDYTPTKSGDQYDDKTVGYFKKAEVWEIWNKADRKVYFIAPSTPGLVLEVRDDPLKLECFWPCPQPLFATQTNDTLVPIPDYAEYQDQAKELDDLTERISKITSAVKVAGVYDASVKELARLLQQGGDNRLIPVDSWAAFAEKGGLKGALSLIPLQEIIETLIRLYEARDRVKADLYEVTGISDIVRGYSGGPAKTATEQRIKGQFASLRLEDRRAAVARFCRETLAIMGEIIAEQFSEESLAQMSGYEQIVADKVREAVEGMPKPPQPQQQPGVPPEMLQQQQQLLMQQFQQAQQQLAMQVEGQAAAEFQKALEILRSDKLRGFRIDIETDSTIQIDAQADKESAIELVTSTLQGLAGAAQMIQAAPELVKPIGDLLLFAYRRFRVGRSIEAQFEEALEQVAKRLENPQKAPNPEQIKAEAEMQKQKLETEREQMRFQNDQQSMQMQMQAKQQEHAMTMAKMNREFEIEEARLALEERKLALDERRMQLKAMQPPEMRPNA
jgi:hypothetical protein